MNRDQSPPVSPRRFRLAAVLLIGCGILSIGAYILHYYYFDFPPEFYSAWGQIKAPSTSVAAIKGNENDWPLIMTKQFQKEFETSASSAEHYGVQVRTLRNTSLVRFFVTGASAERSRAMAAWLTDSYAQSLRRSLANGNFSQPSELPEVLDRANDPASPLRFPTLFLAVQFVTPCLLLLSGFLLLRATRAR